MDSSEELALIRKLDSDAKKMIENFKQLEEPKKNNSINDYILKLNGDDDNQNRGISF